MDIVQLLTLIKGKVLDATNFELLKNAYELQKQNNDQLKENNDALKESNSLFKEKLAHLENEKNELREQISSQKFEAISERELPRGFKRSNNNLLIAPDDTQYCWNCYNKKIGGELRVLNGNQYVQCKICGIGTDIKRFPVESLQTHVDED